MRFRFKYPVIFLLLCFAQHSYAGEVVPDSRADKNPPALTDNRQEGTTIIEADNLVGKAKDQIEATGDAMLRQGAQSIRADTLLFNQSTHEVDAQGEIGRAHV
jgi:LPS-assembly protein